MGERDMYLLVVENIFFMGRFSINQEIFIKYDFSFEFLEINEFKR